MKNRFFLCGWMIAAMMLLSIAFVSCSKGASDTKKYMVPKDASMVIELDMKQLVLKSNFLMYKDDIANLITSAGGDDKAMKRFSQAMREVDDGGMNFNKPVYIFTTADCDGIFVLTSVKHKEEIIRNVQELNDRTRIIEDEKEGVVWAEMDGETVAVITDDAFLIGAAKNDKLFRRILAEGGGFFETPMGATFKAHRGDMTVAVNPKAITPKGRRNLIDMMRNSKMDGLFGDDKLWNLLQKASLVSNIKFSTGEITLNLYSATDEPFDPVCIPISTDVFDQIPMRNTLAVVAAGINGEELAKVIRRELENAGKRIDMEMNLILSALKDVKGSTALSLGLNEWNKNEPEVIATLPVDKSSAQMLSSILSQSFDRSLYVSGENPYSAISNMPSYQYGSVRTKNRIGDRAKGCLLYGFVNFETFYEIMLQEQLENGGYNASDNMSIVAKLVEIFKIFELKMTSNSDLSLVLTMQNNQRNSLDVVLRTILDLAKEEMDRRAAGNNYYYGGYYGEPDYVGYDDDFEEHWLEMDSLEEVAW